MKLLLLISALLLVSCVNTPSDVKCLNGVTYYVSNGYGILTPAYNIDGTLIACKEK